VNASAVALVLTSATSPTLGVNMTKTFSADRGQPAVRRGRLVQLLDEPHVRASHLVEVARDRRRSSFVSSTTRFRFDEDLEGRIQSVEQPPEGVEPA